MILLRRQKLVDGFITATAVDQSIFRRHCLFIIWVYSYIWTQTYNWKKMRYKIKTNRLFTSDFCTKQTESFFWKFDLRTRQTNRFLSLIVLYKGCYFLHSVRMASAHMNLCAFLCVVDEKITWRSFQNMFMRNAQKQDHEWWIWYKKMVK